MGCTHAGCAAIRVLFKNAASRGGDMGMETAALLRVCGVNGREDQVALIEEMIEEVREGRE